MGEGRPATICKVLTTIVSLTRAARFSVYVLLFAVWEHIESGTLVRLIAEQVASEEAFQALWPSGRLVTPKGPEIVELAGVHLKAAVQPKWQLD
jgi:DNA-binding transcriptional LysR family regulator